MANKVIKHYYDECCEPYRNTNFVEPDKSKSISELSTPEVRGMLDRLRSERELEDLIRSLKRNSGERDTFEEPFKVDTKTPINQLYHYGVLDQKWGVRRYQNEDGTLTDLGKKRYKKSESEDHVKATELKKKATSGLTNEELKKLNERLQLEETYKKLTTEKIEKSESFVKSAIAKGGKEALSDFSKNVLLGTAKLLVQEMSPQFAEAAFGLKEKKKK